MNWDIGVLGLTLSVAQAKLSILSKLKTLDVILLEFLLSFSLNSLLVSKLAILSFNSFGSEVEELAIFLFRMSCRSVNFGFVDHTITRPASSRVKIPLD